MTPVVLERDHAGVNTPSGQVTSQTVRKMCELISNSIGDPAVTRATQAAIAAVCRRMEPSPTNAAGAWWMWIKTHLHFRHHDDQIKQLLNETGHYQLLIEPRLLLRMGRPEGDCAIYTMLACAGLVTLGFDCRIVTIACDRETPGRYSHVCAQVWLPDAKVWATFDASHGTALGWEVPTFDQYRRTSWDLNGNVVSDVTVSADQRARARGGMGDDSSYVGFRLKLADALPWIFNIPAAAVAAVAPGLTQNSAAVVIGIDVLAWGGLAYLLFGGRD